MKRLVLVLTLILVSASGHASADGGLDADSFKLYGGTWLSDCGNPGSPRVTVSESALVVIEGGRRVDGSNLQNAPSYFGQSPPENYVTTLLADLPSGDQLLAVLYTDAGGIYLALELGPISKGAMGLKYRRCDTPAKASTAQPPPVTATPPTPGLPGASDLLRDPAFKKAYVKALGRFAKEPWLMQLDGPAPETRKVTIAGTEYFLISSCKNHDCAENNMTVLYAPSKNLVQGKVRLAGKSALIGSPPPAVAKELVSTGASSGGRAGRRPPAMDPFCGMAPVCYESWSSGRSAGRYDNQPEGRMATKLDKSLKRELDIDGKLYTLTISPQGLLLTEKGHRKGRELSWKDLLGDDAALAAALNASGRSDA